MLDENAFGLLVSYLAIEDDEYSLEVTEFTARLRSFGEEVRAFLAETPLAKGLQVVDFGHALYLEFADGDQETPLIGWLKRLRQRLQDSTRIEVACILSHGSRWTTEGTSLPVQERDSDTVITKLAHSSEALRRAFYAETACHGDDDAPGWGPGVYVDTEAVDALELALRNAPTPLEMAGATFYRAGS